MYPRCSEEAKKHWKQIPQDLDILLTHGPAYGILDRNMWDERCGCEVLVREIAKKRPKWHVFGHIHGHGGKIINQEGVNFVNASVLDEEYKVKNNPIYFEI